jgi:polyisoprenoid-binding protein YceI
MKFLTILVYLTSFYIYSAEECVYEYDSKNTTLEWKAFKFTERAGVAGTFNLINVESKKSSSLQKWAESVKFTIPISSVNTKNPDRDSKIQKFFFGSLKNSSKLTGSFQSVQIKENKGTADLLLKLNDTEKKVPVNFTIKEDTIQLNTMIDVNNWSAQKGIQALNKECNALHIGKDGVSKLWSEVEISILSKISKTCKK